MRLSELREECGRVVDIARGADPRPRRAIPPCCAGKLVDAETRIAIRKSRFRFIIKYAPVSDSPQISGGCLFRLNTEKVMRVQHAWHLLGSIINEQFVDQLQPRRLPLGRPWRVVLEQLGHRLLEVAVVFVGILADVERLGSGAAPHKLFGSRVE
jgi:hypothetical protein